MRTKYNSIQKGELRYPTPSPFFDIVCRQDFRTWLKKNSKTSFNVLRKYRRAFVSADPCDLSDVTDVEAWINFYKTKCRNRKKIRYIAIVICFTTSFLLASKVVVSWLLISGNSGMLFWQ